MMVFYGFRVDGDRSTTEGGMFPHPGLYAGDIMMLCELFPNNPALKNAKYNNILYITREEARALLEDMKRHEQEHGVSAEPYITSIIGGPVSSNFRSVFDDLIPYLEEVTGLAPKGSAAKTYAARPKSTG